LLKGGKEEGRSISILNKFRILITQQKEIRSKIIEQLIALPKLHDMPVSACMQKGERREREKKKEGKEKKEERPVEGSST